jgi:hypothetical protein
VSHPFFCYVLLLMTFCVARPVLAQASRSENLPGPESPVPTYAQLILMPIGGISKTLGELEKVSFGVPRKDCVDYFRPTVEPRNLLASVCLSKNVTDTRFRWKVTVNRGANTLITADVTLDTPMHQERLTERLLNLDFEELTDNIQSLTIQVNQPVMSLVIDKAGENVKAKLKSESFEEVLYETNISTHHGYWEFSEISASGVLTAIRWTAVKPEGFFIGSQEETLSQSGKSTRIGKTEFYGAVNRWFTDPACAAGERALEGFGQAIGAPEIAQQFKRDCKMTGIGVDGKRLWFPSADPSSPDLPR